MWACSHLPFKSQSMTSVIGIKLNIQSCYQCNQWIISNCSICINIWSTKPDILKAAELLERTHQSLNTCEIFCGIFIHTANIQKCLVHLNVQSWLLDYSCSTEAHSCVLGIKAEENKILRHVGSSLLQTVKTFGALHTPAIYSSWIIYLHYFTHLQVGLAFEPFPILLVELAVVQLIQLPRWNQNSLCQSAKINVNNKLHYISFPHGHSIRMSEHCPHKTRSIVLIRQIFHTL